MKCELWLINKQKYINFSFFYQSCGEEKFRNMEMGYWNQEHNYFFLALFKDCSFTFRQDHFNFSFYKPTKFNFSKNWKTKFHLKINNYIFPCLYLTKMYLFWAQIIDGTIKNYVTRNKQLYVCMTNIMGIVKMRYQELN